MGMKIVVLIALLGAISLLMLGCTSQDKQKSGNQTTIPKTDTGASMQPSGAPKADDLPSEPKERLLVLLKRQQNGTWSVVRKENGAGGGEYKRISFKDKDTYSYVKSKDSAMQEAEVRTYISDGKLVGCGRNSQCNSLDYPKGGEIEQNIFRGFFFLKAEDIAQTPAEEIVELSGRHIAHTDALCFKVPFGMFGYGSEMAAVARKAGSLSIETYCFSADGVPLYKRIEANGSLISEEEASGMAYTVDENDFKH